MCAKPTPFANVSPNQRSMTFVVEASSAMLYDLRLFNVGHLA